MQRIYGKFKSHMRDDQVLSAADMFDDDFFPERKTSKENGEMMPEVYEKYDEGLLYLQNQSYV